MIYGNIKEYIVSRIMGTGTPCYTRVCVSGTLGLYGEKTPHTMLRIMRTGTLECVLVHWSIWVGTHVV